MADSSRPSDTALSEKLQSCVEKVIGAGVPGISAAICTSQGLSWSDRAGFADIENGNPIAEHVFGIGSITKVFISVVILQLIDERQLALGDTVSIYLQPTILTGIPNASQATIGALLRHHSGVPSWEDDPMWIREGRGTGLDPSKIWTSTETLDYIRYDSNPHTLPPVPEPTPGKYSYSNTNFTLLGLIAEAITKQPAHRLIRVRILEPLHLSHTYLEGFESRPITDGAPSHAQVLVPQRYHWATPTFQQSAGINPAFSTPPSRPDLVNASVSNLSTEWVAGGNLSHPSDLCTFALAIRNARILSPASRELMFDCLPIGEKGWIGHGIFKMVIGNEAWLGHNGSVLGFAGSMFWNYKVDVAVAVLGNVGTMHAAKVPGSAASVISDTDFLDLALELAGK